LDSYLTYFPTPRGQLVPTAARGPLPILYLAGFVLLFDEPYYPILLMSWALAAGTALAMYGVAYQLTRARQVALLTAVLSGFHLSAMEITTTFSYCSEPLFIFLLASAAYVGCLAARGGDIRYAALSGLLLGLACLCRQIVLFVPAAYLLIFWYLHRDRWLALTCAACAAFAIVQVPWVVRNQLVFGKPIITSTLGGYGLYMSAVTARERDPARLDYDWPDTAGVRGEMLRELADAGRSLDSINEAELDAFLRVKGKEILSENRLGYLRNCAWNLIAILYRLDSGRGIYMLQNGVYYLFAAVGIVVAWRRRHWALAAPLLLIGYFVVIHTPLIPAYRYFLPVAPFLFIFTAIGVCAACSWCSQRMRPVAICVGTP
jgi:4-amino-4-deoxy-L-arabinose transferase-like glycosyltransferase